jgi:hypothetical protein
MLLILTVLAFHAAPLRAQWTVKFYRESIASQNKDIVRATTLYVKGLGDGMVWANSGAKIYSKAPLFCEPDKLALAPDNYLSIIDQEISEMATKMAPKQLDQTALALVLFTGLRTTFPCGNRK